MSCWKEVVFFIFGFFFSVILFECLMVRNYVPSSPKHVIHSQLNHALKDNSHLYDETLKEKLFDEVKVACWVMTHSDNHKTRDPALKSLWGKRCNKLLFFSDAYDPDLPTIDLKIPKGRQNLWLKTQAAFVYMYENHLHEFDWFLRADDDNYIVMENLRYLLYQYNSNDSLYFGHRFALRWAMEHGYMAGGGLVLSKEAVRRFNEDILPNSEKCRSAGDGVDDWILGDCLKDHAVFVDNRDEHQAKRFFPLGVKIHMEKTLEHGYWSYSYYQSPQGNLDCCSDTYVASHYIYPTEAHLLEYFIYHVHPFGLEKPNKLPPKLTSEEVKRAGEAPSFKEEVWKLEDEAQRVAEEAAQKAAAEAEKKAAEDAMKAAEQEAQRAAEEKMSATLTVVEEANKTAEESVAASEAFKTDETTAEQ